MTFSCLFVFNLLTCLCSILLCLAFMSGSDRIPAYGLEYFGFAIQDPGWENPDNFFPLGNTCSHLLILPRYSSKEILEKKLLCAIEHDEGFALK